MKYVRTNVPGWVLDEDTGTVINTNTTQLEQLKAARAKNREINALKEDVEKLKKMLTVICINLGLNQNV